MEKILNRVNHQIRASKVVLIKDGQNIGQFPIDTARRMARELELDLVELNPGNIPVCTIIDFGKFRYDQEKKKKQQRQNQVKEKEICFRYVITDHDLDTKIKHAKEILQKGDKVKLVVKFKKRENAHKDQGFVLIKRCLESLADFQVEKNPAMEGDRIICRVSPKLVKN